MFCKIYTPLAYAMFIYIIGSIYLIATRNIGTPFKNSLSKDNYKKQTQLNNEKIYFILDVV